MMFLSRASRALPVFALPALLGAALAPTAAQACSCGCGIFDVGAGSVTPQSSDSGLSVFFGYDYMNQTRNRDQGHAASPADNQDKRLESAFYTVGAQYMIDRKWMAMAEVPIVDRHFTTTVDAPGGGSMVETAPLTALGDLVLNLTYTGFAADMSTGLGFGVKLPTGRDTSPFDRAGNQPYDRDSLPGTGSTDLQVDGYHVGMIGAAHWFAQAQYRFAVATHDGYRPGNELDAALGVSYDVPLRGATKLSPTLSLLGSTRGRDSGVESDPYNTGYQRLLIAPGLRVQVTRKLSVYGDVELPVAQYVNAARPGDDADSSGQLVAPAFFKLQLNYGF